MQKIYLSENIAYLVSKSGLSQDDFGALLGLKRGAVNTYINNKAFPKIDTLIKICEDYEVSLDDLIRSLLDIEKPYGIKDGKLLTSNENNPEPYMISPRYVEVLEKALEDKEKIIKSLEEKLGTAGESKTA